MHEFIIRTATLFTQHYLWLIFGIFLLAAITGSWWLGRTEGTWRGRLGAPLNWYSRKRNVRRLTFNILGAALILWGVQMFTLWISPTLRPSQLFTSPLLGSQPVKVTQAKIGVLDELATYTGTVRPWQDDIVYARVGGWLTKLNVYPGDVVHKNEILATLDLSSLLPALDKAKAQTLYWQAEFKRDHSLYKDGAISASHFDVTRMHYQTAQAALQRGETDVGYATLRSPINGIVAKRHVYPGAYVHKGEMLVKIDDLHKVRIQFDVGESDLQWIHPGDRVYLHFPQISSVLLKKLYPKRFTHELNGTRGVLKAYVAVVFPRVNLQTRTGKIEVRINNHELMLRSNSYVVGDLVRRHVNKGVLVPTSALTTEPDGQQVVFVAPQFSSEGPVQKRSVVVGVRGQNRVQILKGIKPGEFVVTLGNRMLTDGQTVVELNRGGSE